MRFEHSIFLLICIFAFLQATFAAPTSTLVSSSVATPLRALGCNLLPSAHLQLHKQENSPSAETYQLVFVSHDPSLDTAASASSASASASSTTSSILPDYVDIHYRINNDAAVNLRAISQMHVSQAERAPQVEVNGIVLKEGDTLRYFATFVMNENQACDTDIQTFTAPINELISQQQNEMHTMATLEEEEDAKLVDSEKCMQEVDIKFDKDGNLENTYQLSLSNKSPKQLEFVDLYVSVPHGEESALRLGSDLQFTHTQTVQHHGIYLPQDQALTYQFTWKYTNQKDSCTTDKVIAHAMTE